MLDVVIGDIGSRGDGIAIVHGYQIYVPGSKMGERLKIKIVSVGGKFATAEKVAARPRAENKNEAVVEEAESSKP